MATVFKEKPYIVHFHSLGIACQFSQCRAGCARNVVRMKTVTSPSRRQDSHFVGRSSFRLPRFLRGGVGRVSSLSFSESSCSSRFGSRLSRNPFSREGGLRLRLWHRRVWGSGGASSDRLVGALGVPGAPGNPFFSEAFLSCLGQQRAPAWFLSLSACPLLTTPLCTCATDTDCLSLSAASPVRLLYPPPTTLSFKDTLPSTCRQRKKIYQDNRKIIFVCWYYCQSLHVIRNVGKCPLRG